VHDVETGRPLERLKPALVNAVRHDVPPVVAGDYLFCLDSGGGSHGGHPTHGQMVVATADDRLQIICRNFVDIDTGSSPVFGRNRMYLRSGSALTCIAATTPDGRQYEQRRLAATLLEEIGSRPKEVAARVVPPLESPSLGSGAPVGRLMDGRAVEHWLGAGPFPSDAAGNDAALSALRPRAGSKITLGSRTRRFEPLSREHAWRDPPEYRRQHALQGTGDIVPFFSTWVDPRCCSGPQGTGLLYTVLVNNRDRVVAPTCDAPGVTQWLGGQRLEPSEPLGLRPGFYPFLVRVDPAYYAAGQRRSAAVKTSEADKPSTQTGGRTSFRIALAFRYVPHPATVRHRWRERVRSRRASLEALVQNLPKTVEAQEARRLLREISEGKGDAPY
jgi:hypothetical protein